MMSVQAAQNICQPWHEAISSHLSPWYDMPPCLLMHFRHEFNTQAVTHHGPGSQC